MNYIVFDLEWNQSNTGREKEVEKLPFEIIEIGAVKIDDTCVTTGEFHALIRPQVYREMHHVTGKLIQLNMKELEKGEDFPKTMEAFLDWCGSGEYLFCTWGSLDLMELQRNMKYYNMTPLSEGPIAYLDGQKLFLVIPFIKGLGFVQAFVALKAHEFPAEHPGSRLGHFRFADARRALDEQRAPEFHGDQKRIHPN